MFVEPNVLDRTSFPVGENHSFPDKVGLHVP